MTTQSEKPEFMLLLRQPHTGPHPSPQEMERIMARFTQWMDGMSAKNLVVGTSGLEVTGKVLRGPRGTTLTDGPYAEGAEIVGGYVIVKAEDENAAVELARDCPGLDYRMVVEVKTGEASHEDKGLNALDFTFSVLTREAMPPENGASPSLTVCCGQTTVLFFHPCPLKFVLCFPPRLPAHSSPAAAIAEADPVPLPERCRQGQGPVSTKLRDLPLDRRLLPAAGWTGTVARWRRGAVSRRPHSPASVTPRP